jgi:hypothetical protein
MAARGVFVLACSLGLGCSPGSAGHGQDAGADGPADLGPGSTFSLPDVSPPPDGWKPPPPPADPPWVTPAKAACRVQGSAGPVDAGAGPDGPRLLEVLPVPVAAWANPRLLAPSRLADLLARFLWRTDADEDLRARVESCAPEAPSDVIALATAMLADPRAAGTVEAFYRWWLDLDRIATVERDPKVFPELDDELRRSMAREPLQFAAHVTLKGDGRFETLIAGSFSFVDRPLARLYRIPEPPPGEPVLTSLDASERAGLLTQPGILALGARPDRTSPSLRGAYVHERFLCTGPQLHTADGDRNLPPATPEAPTLRARLSTITPAFPCKECHDRLDLTGFAFEPFDALGRRRSTDNGAPIDSTGRLLGEAVRDAVELAHRLAGRAEAQQCFVQKWLDFATGGRAQWPSRDTVDAVFRAFARSGLDIKVLIATTTGTRAFLERP